MATLNSMSLQEGQRLACAVIKYYPKLWHIDDKDLWHHKDSLLSLNGYDLCL